MEFNPTLTPSSTKLSITGVDYLGSSMTFVIKRKRVMVTLTSQQEMAPRLEIFSYNKVHNLIFNRTISLAHGKGIIRLHQ
jgi:hypothetical protein